LLELENTGVKKDQYIERVSLSEVSKEMSQISKEVFSLAKVIAALLKGDDPNINELLGQYTKQKTNESLIKGDEFTIKDIELLKETLKLIRKNICDYYAEKYSNECFVQ